MGYRSEVAVAVKKECYEALVAGYSDESKKNIEELISYGEKHENEYGILLHWQDIKWYSDYDDIAAFMKSLKNIDDKDWYMIRIGDDSDDTEINGCWWDNTFDLSVRREMNMSI